MAVAVTRLPLDLEGDMAETFFTLADGSPRAVMGIRRKSDGTVQTLDQSVPDGDTVGLQLDGTGSVRFLGIDSPEKSFEHQGAAGAGRIAAAWQRCAAAARPVWDVTGRRSRSDDGPGRRSPPQGVPGLSTGRRAASAPVRRMRIGAFAACGCSMFPETSCEFG